MRKVIRRAGVLAPFPRQERLHAGKSRGASVKESRAIMSLQEADSGARYQCPAPSASGLSAVRSRGGRAIEPCDVGLNRRANGLGGCAY